MSKPGFDNLRERHPLSADDSVGAPASWELFGCLDVLHEKQVVCPVRELRMTLIAHSRALSSASGMPAGCKPLSICTRRRIASDAVHLKSISHACKP